MGQVLHGSATTTEAVRRAIQHSQESLRARWNIYSAYISGVLSSPFGSDLLLDLLQNDLRTSFTASTFVA